MVKVSVREGRGSLSEWEDDESLLTKLHELQAQGVAGRALISQLMEVNSESPPLSMRLSGTDAAGDWFDEFICFE